MTFGEKLRTLRLKKELTQMQLAKEAGLGLNTISNYEKGKTYPQNREVYATLAKILDVSPDYLHNENIRPLTDKVIVKAPDTVEYALDLKYYINKSDSVQANTIQSAVNAAVENYIVWQRSKIGRDINPSKLICMLEDAGAKRVEINAPVFRKIEKTAVAKVTTKKVAYGGIEDD